MTVVVAIQAFYFSHYDCTNMQTRHVIMKTIADCVFFSEIVRKLLDFNYMVKKFVILYSLFI